MTDAELMYGIEAGQFDLKDVLVVLRNRVLKSNGAVNIRELESEYVPFPKKPFYSIKEVAGIFRWNEKTVSRLIHNGRIGAIKDGSDEGPRYRIPYAEVMRIWKNGVNSNSAIKSVTWNPDEIC
jgi:excisionase family DNA binding protein